MRRPDRITDIVVLGQQGLKGSASRGLANANHFEAEDVFVDCTGADRASFTSEDSDLDLRVRRQLGALVRSKRPGTSLPAVGSRVRLKSDYRIAIALVRTPWDVTLLETVENLRQRADFVILWIFEMWPSDVTSELALAPFHLADLVIVGPCTEAALSLDAIISPPVHFMPAGIDIDTFGVRDLDRERHIDFMNIGRRQTAFHDAFLERARIDQRSYLFDTTTPGLLTNHREHRWLLAQHYRSTKVAMTSAAKFNLTDSSAHATRAVPNRLYEAMAAGTVMVGAPPPSEANQASQVGAVVVRQLPHEAQAAVAVVEQLIATDLTEERHHNATLARRFHDWGERWLRIFELADEDPPDQLLMRRERLS